MPPFLYRFVRDLRIDDHAGLARAATYGDVIPVLVIDRALETRLARSPRRAAFFCSAVASLDAALRDRGVRLIVRRGEPATALRALARATSATGVAWSASYDGATRRRDERLQWQLEEAGLRAVIVHDAPAIPFEETAAARPGSGDGYRAFAPYFDVWKSIAVASYDVPLIVRFAQTNLQSDPLPRPEEFGAPSAAVEGSTAAGAHALLRRFLNESAVQYSIAVNVPSEDRTSHLSAHLSFGTISARAIVRATHARLDDPFLLSEERASLRLFLRSIAMRDFFFQLGHAHPEIDERPLQEKMRAFSAARTHPLLDAWREGRTGYPLVDAGMRQLNATGWMHPHVRAVAASFLCFDLGIDWRVGRDEWERRLVEDDPALASGNWQWIAGVGADMAQYPRIYNPEKQRRRYDPLGTYVKRWVPELAGVPILSGGRSASNDTQLSLALWPQREYPEPIVDHERAARAFLERYRAYRVPP
jgi:deoxyribodipyrimidine photo-lyase